MHPRDIPLGAVAVGLDGSLPSERALGWAIDAALDLRRPLALVHATRPAATSWMGSARRASSRRERTGAKAPAERLVARAHARVEQSSARLEVVEVLCTADPRDVLLEVSRRVSTLVLGARGRGPVGPLLLGSVSAALTRHALCPTVVTGGARAPESRGVQVGLECLAHAPRLLDVAWEHAERLGGEVTVVHGASPRDGRVPHGRSPAPRPDGMLLQERSGLEAALGRLHARNPRIGVRTVTPAGESVSDHLVRHSATTQLVVVGHVLRGTSASRFSGSDSASVVEHAACPVAVVPLGTG